MSSIISLKDRMEDYQKTSDLKLLNRAPVVIVVNGRGFRKLTHILQKPFCPLFTKTMCGVMIKLMSEVDNSLVGYCYGDEIIIVMQNNKSLDAEPYMNNKIQKICSTTASLATLSFNNLSKENKLDLFGDSVFNCEVFSLPDQSEIINLLVHKQTQSFNASVNNACFHELLKHYNIDDVRQLIFEKTTSEKIEILSEKCDINFDNYPLLFTRGVLSFRKMVKVGEKEKMKLIIDLELPMFAKNQNFLRELIK